MSAALKACQKLKNKKPQDHNDDCDPSYRVKHGPLPAGAEYAPVEEERAELHTSKCGVSQDVEGDFRLGRYWDH